MAVMANTMTMTARERLAEYATPRPWPPALLVKLLFGESLMIAVIGGAIGMALTFPLTAAFVQQTANAVQGVRGRKPPWSIKRWQPGGVAGYAWPAWKMSYRHRARLAPRGLRQYPMRAIPRSYVMRNLWVRRVTTALTAGGMALVVFATVLMMSEGISETMVATGQPDNVVVMRKGAGNEINSNITRDQANAIDTLPGVATDNQGRKLVSREAVALNNLPKRDGSTANVIMRGMSEFGTACGRRSS